MGKYGRELGEDTNFGGFTKCVQLLKPQILFSSPANQTYKTTTFVSVGGALVDVGESMKRLAEVKDSLDIDVKQNFIDPLQGLCDKDLREIQVCFSSLSHTRI